MILFERDTNGLELSLYQFWRKITLCALFGPKSEIEKDGSVVMHGWNSLPREEQLLHILLQNSLQRSSFK